MIAFALLAFLTAAPWSAEHRPRFEDFPVTSIWRGRPAPLHPSTVLPDDWRIDLPRAAKGPVNFAGRYHFALWMCGSNCAGGAIVDLSTGRVYQPPLARPADGTSYFVMASTSDGPSIEFRTNSRLLIMKGGPNPINAYYFVWEGNTFRRILFVPGAPGRQPLSP